MAEQYPARPPRVTFRDGELSIIADNSTLADILAAVHQRTGAAMDLPANLGNDRVAVKLGPAATDEVLAALLNGSHFDYIVVNHRENPLSPERIILREKASADSSAVNSGFAPSVATVYPQPVETQEMPEIVPEEEPPPPPGGMAENPGGAVKTPEQLLQEIQQMKQRQGQQGPQPQPPLVPPPQPPLSDNNNPPPQPQ